MAANMDAVGVWKRIGEIGPLQKLWDICENLAKCCFLHSHIILRLLPCQSKKSLSLCLCVKAKPFAIEVRWLILRFRIARHINGGFTVVLC